MSEQPSANPLRRSLVLILLAAALVLVGADAADAYRRPDGSPCTPRGALRWRFASNGDSTAAQRDIFRDNVDDWDYLRTSTGAKFLSSVETTTDVNVDVRWATNVVPSTNCTNTVRVITLDSDDSDLYIAFASTHEAGHAHGMRHTGDKDNLTPDGAPAFPVMGCGPLPDPLPTAPLGDDVAQAYTRFGPRATPNWGFENGLSFWTRSSSNVVQSTTAYEGSNSVLLPPGEWIRTRVRIAEPGLHRMVARYQATASGASQNLRFRVSMVSVDYDTYPFDSDACPEIKFFTEGSTIQNPVDTNKTPTASWQLFSQDFTVSGGSEGIRGSVWVYNNTAVNVRVDNLALEER